MAEDILRITKEELLNALVGADKKKMGIFVHCTQDLEKSLKSLEESMNRNAESSQSLAAKVYWLNWILVLATVVIAIAAIVKQ